MELQSKPFVAVSEQIKDIGTKSEHDLERLKKYIAESRHRDTSFDFVSRKPPQHNIIKTRTKVFVWKMSSSFLEKNQDFVLKLKIKGADGE